MKHPTTEFYYFVADQSYYSPTNILETWYILILTICDFQKILWAHIIPQNVKGLRQGGVQERGNETWTASILKINTSEGFVIVVLSSKL